MVKIFIVLFCSIAIKLIKVFCKYSKRLKKNVENSSMVLISLINTFKRGVFDIDGLSINADATLSLSINPSRINNVRS